MLASFLKRPAEKPVAGFQPPMLGRGQICRDPERAQIFQGPFDLTQACFEQFQPGREGRFGARLQDPQWVSQERPPIGFIRDPIRLDQPHGFGRPKAVLRGSRQNGLLIVVG